MSKTAIEVITSVQRRRRWSSAEKERLVAASLEPGACVSALAREAGMHPEPALWLATQIVRAAASTSGVYGRGFRARADIGWVAGCRRDRDRVCERLAHADHGSDRPRDADGGSFGASWRRAAAMIPIPAGPHRVSHGKPLHMLVWRIGRVRPVIDVRGARERHIG
jgi:hypothetical protein